jgi:hypothetical protein
MREPCPTCRKPDCNHQPELPLLSPAANLLEIREIQKFMAACRQHWPGVKITLRPNSEFAHKCGSPPDDPAIQTESRSNGKRE